MCSRSGFAKALENVPNGYSCIVYSDDPAKWAKAIEAVRVRHGMRLREIKALKASYGEMYSWRKQCDVLVERMKKMIYGMIELDTGLCLDIFSTRNNGKIN